MNQSVLFPELQDWNTELEVVEFPVQISGALISCSISLKKLREISGNTKLEGASAIECFLKFRFDIEELIEEMIEDERYNDLDQISIN
jgi:hypothetical protein